MSSNGNCLPGLFSDLEPLASWALPTERERYAMRSNASPDELMAFYKLMAPRLESVIEYLEGFPFEALPEAERQLLLLTFSMAEVSAAVEKYDCKQRYAFDLDRHVPIHDF